MLSALNNNTGFALWPSLAGGEGGKRASALASASAVKKGRSAVGGVFAPFQKKKDSAMALQKKLAGFPSGLHRKMTMGGGSICSFGGFEGGERTLGSLAGGRDFQSR